ncbi:MAG: hypothetical protein DWQ05_11730 [Calditrichaeota bacterium]|nr:MAG: hypothetical protein DWQ05_11730 [Calditrichota bacterium]
MNSVKLDWRKALVAFLVFFSVSDLSAQSKAKAGYLENIFRDRENVHQCTALFLHNLAALHDSTDYNFHILNRLHTDLLELMSVTEDKIWFQLKNNKLRADFIAHFWKRRDPTRPTLANERLFEHYKRLLYARDQYGNNSARTFDDRGRVYVRYGKADETYIELPNEYAEYNFSERTPVVGNDDMSFRKQFETWYYHRLKPKVVFDFVEGSDGYNITYQVDQGLQTMDLNVWYKALGKIIERRKTISPTFQSMAFNFKFGVTANEQGEAEMRSTLMDFGQKYSEEMQKRHKEIPPTESTHFEDLPFDFSISYFENLNDEQTCIVSYGIENKSIKFGKHKSEVKLQFSTALSDSFYNVFAEENATTQINKSDGTRNMAAAHKFDFRPGDFYVFVEALNSENRQLGKKATFMKHAVRPADSLGLSSILFAENISGSALIGAANSNTIVERNGVFIQPTPFRNLDKKSPPFVYFEIYGLDKNDEGKTNYNIDYIVKEGKDEGVSKIIGKLNPFDSGKTLIQISDNREGNNHRDSAFVQLDLSRLKKGNYALYVRVRDEVSNKMQMIVTPFSLN